MKPFVVRWDWKGEPDWEEINASLGGWRWPPMFYRIETCGDDYAVIVSPIKLSEKEQVALWNEYINPS